MEDQILPMVQAAENLQEEPLPIMEPSNEETAPVIEPIPDSDEGVDDIPELIPDPNQGVIGLVTVIITEANGGVIQINDTPTRESEKKSGIFPHKYIFKDIVTDSDVMQKVAPGDAPAEENVFSDDETAVYSTRPPDTLKVSQILILN